METLKWEQDLPKEAHEVGLLVGALVKAIADASADGKFDPTTEIPMAIMQVMQPMAAAFAGIDKMKDEFSGEEGTPVAAVMAILAPIAKEIEELLKK